MNASTLYEEDYYAWTNEQARLIKTKDFSKLDIENLLEEIADMGASQVRELESRLEVLLMHLLKWNHQPNLQSHSWKYTIKEQRRKIERCLRKMPSLKSQLDESFIDAYGDAIYEAVKETGLLESTFPKTCEWSIKQVLDPDFFPN